MYAETVKMNHVHFATELARSGLKAAEVAELAGVRPETISRARNGHRVRVSTVERLAEVFEVPAAHLMEGKEVC